MANKNSKCKLIAAKKLLNNVVQFRYNTVCPATYGYNEYIYE